MAVVGVGVVGAAVGWNLARRGVRVVLVDAGRPGEGVTNWSFSWVNASNKTATRAYFDLNVAGMAAHRDLAARIGPEAWWHPSGHLRWADEIEAEARLFRTGELLTRWGYRVEPCTGADARRRFEPALAVPDDTRVLFYPDEAWVHGRRLVGRLVDEALACGAELRTGAAVRDIATGPEGRVRSLALSDGATLPVDAVVNAAGPDAARVAGLVGRRLPMREEPGAVTRLDCAESPVRRAMHTPHVEIRPDGDGSVVLHSREVDALIGASDAEPESELGLRLHALARRVVPDLDHARIARTRVVHRPVPGDGFPSVGALPSVPGYHEAVTHSGITLGPVLGRLLADEVVGGRRDPLLAEYRPDRF
ncbi:NAD(P)/FAD-dependent oxidoreductase [Streptomyces sp. SDT5-1]|uniref:NAD(P)/FAD-dependent oxidoreductase n=1 Tax=Streptomyces sp. SDT5-1 TaxID=3406418 RepID=UPI003FD0BE7A